MPYQFENIPINNPVLDKRVKLSHEDKQNIIREYQSGAISITSLAKKYGVSKRLIQFTLFPERKEKAKQAYLERRKDGRYYDRKKHTQQTKKHRNYKKELWEKGLLNKD